VCVAGKTVTVVVPDELQPGQVLAVRPRPALLLPLLLPCSHPCPGLLCSALLCPSARRGYTYFAYYAHYAHFAYCTQVTAPPKRKVRPSDIVRKQRVIQAREDLRQRQLPSRGWEDVDDPGGVR